MIKNMAIYLPHLTPRVAANVEGSKLPSFLIALEAWRRGLTVTVKHKKFFHYSITYQKEQKGWKKYLAKLLPLTLNRQDKVTYSFYRGIANIVPPKTLRAAKDKDLAKLYLSRVGISVPEGKNLQLLHLMGRFWLMQEIWVTLWLLNRLAAQGERVSLQT